VVQHIFGAVKGWIDEFDIDGIRLDVAYCLDKEFIKRLRAYCDSLKLEFFLLGELLHGDYNQFMNDDMLHSATNYECYKGLFSSFNSMNLFEIVHSLLRQFGPENWTLYKGKHLLSFVDNHDVSRIASNLSNEAHLPLIYAMAFGMPGIPCVYYGSEWGAKASKSEGDPALRACFNAPVENELTAWIAKLTEAKKHSKALNYGDFKSIGLTNRQCIFERRCGEERVLVAINADADEFTAHFDAGCGCAVDLITGEKFDFGGGTTLPGYSAKFLLTEY
jgi:cyclomaltodextrinase / maltogenic alpha-amylase / neopullulanase